MDKDIKLQPSDVQNKAQSVAGAMAQAAKPGPVPVAGAGSPIDAALAGVAGAISTNIAASSAKLATQGAEGLAKSTTAVARMSTAEQENAAQVATVPEGLTEGPGVAT